MSALRKWLFAGLLVIVPLVITLGVLNWIIGTLDQTLAILPEAWHPDRLLGFHIPGFGVVLTLLILLVVGAAASNFIGRKLVSWGDAVVSRIPVVRSIYSSVKQVSDTVFSDSGNAFRTAVLVQWPREGVWTVAFVTGSPSGEVAAYLRDEYLSVFVPTTRRISSVSTTPKPGIWKPSNRSGCQASGRMVSVWSSVPMIQLSTPSVITSGTITSRPANSHLRRADMKCKP